MALTTDEEVPPVPTTIFALIHELHTTISDAIDTSLSWDTLNSPPINYSLVRPIVERFTPKPPDEKVKGALKLAGTQLLSAPKPDRGESGNGTAIQDDAGAVSFGGVLYALMVNRCASTSHAPRCALIMKNPLYNVGGRRPQFGSPPIRSSRVLRAPGQCVTSSMQTCRLTMQ